MGLFRRQACSQGLRLSRREISLESIGMGFVLILVKVRLV